jgi:hypothetical protein
MSTSLLRVPVFDRLQLGVGLLHVVVVLFHVARLLPLRLLELSFV